MGDYRFAFVNKREPAASTALFSKKEAEKAYDFHRGIPGYEPTPLLRLKRLAAETGIGDICIKDESKRFGLNAFKVLGGSYAIARAVWDRLDMPEGDLSYNRLISAEVREKLGRVTFVTATDGNHGRGVAWTANRLGCGCVVYMPRDTAPERLKNIRLLGADASILSCEYDECVEKARLDAERYGWILVQDTVMPGYETIPSYIMQGYMTLGVEALEQMPYRPTHVFLQAGVGSMAAALAAFLKERYGDDCPRIIVLEPNGADCFFRTAEVDDGSIHPYPGRLHSIMAGLCCGVPNPVAWEILRDLAEVFVSMPDSAAATAMRIMANPLPGDPSVVCGESGASGIGLLLMLLRRPDLAEYREKLGLDGDARVLCISTEGDTDRENYRRILWDGLWPNE